MYKYKDKAKENEMGEACSIHDEKRNTYRILVGKPERERPLGRPSCRWANNIKINPRYRMEWY
jgi:hypothetical protein